jgi:hypothetical protein
MNNSCTAYRARFAREGLPPLREAHVPSLLIQFSLPRAGSFYSESKRANFHHDIARFNSKQNVLDRRFCLDSKRNADSSMCQLKRLDSKQGAHSPALRRANCAKHKGVMLMES